MLVEDALGSQVDHPESTQFRSAHGLGLTGLDSRVQPTGAPSGGKFYGLVVDQVEVLGRADESGVVEPDGPDEDCVTPMD